MMKVSAILVGAAAVFAASAANATTIFNSITTASAGYLVMPNSVANNPGGPIGDSFSVTGPTTLTSVSLQLFDSTPSDGGSVLVYLVPNSGSNLPTVVGGSKPVTLTGDVLLGTILDSSLPTAKTGAATTLNSLTNAFIASAGTYWIEVVSSCDPYNGGTSCTSGAKLAYNATSAGTVGTSGQFSDYTTDSTPGTEANAVFVQNTDTNNEFEMSITATTTPEPASLAILGAGLAGLGFSRRRKAKKTAE